MSLISASLIIPDVVWIFNGQACSLILTPDNQPEVQHSGESTRQWSWEDLRKLKNSYVFLLSWTWVPQRYIAMHIATFQKQARVVKSFCDALLRLGCVSRSTGAIPLRKNNIGRKWLMYLSYTDIFTFPFLSKPMFTILTDTMEKLQSPIIQNVEDQTPRPEVTMINSIAAINYCCTYFWNNKTTWANFICSFGDFMGIDDFISTTDFIELICKNFLHLHSLGRRKVGKVG